MQINPEALRRQDPEAVFQLTRLCQRCARTGAFKVGAEGFVDDIAQDMVMAVLTKFLDRYDGVSDIDPFLVEMARRMGLGYLRKHRREITALPQSAQDRDVIHEHPDLDAALPDEVVHEEVTEVQAKEAKAKLVERIRSRSHNHPAQANARARRKPRKPSRVTPMSTKEHGWYRIDLKPLLRAHGNPDNPLYKCRQDTGLSQQALATALGITITKLRDIERTTTVPRRLKAKLEEIWDREVGGVGEMDGPTCVKRWSEQLGIDLDRSTELAEVIGVHRATIYRWRTGKTHPPGCMVRKLNVLVSVLAERRGRMLRGSRGHAA